MYAHIWNKANMNTIRVKWKKALYPKKPGSIRERVRHTLAFLYICAFTRN